MITYILLNKDRSWCSNVHNCILLQHLSAFGLFVCLISFSLFQKLSEVRHRQIVKWTKTTKVKRPKASLFQTLCIMYVVLVCRHTHDTYINVKSFSCKTLTSYHDNTLCLLLFVGVILLFFIKEKTYTSYKSDSLTV